MTEPGTVVLGVGSTLMGDDGVGVRAAALLAERLAGIPGVEVVDGGTWGMQLLPALEEAARLLVVDAIHADVEAGTVIRLEKGELPRLLYQKVSPHQIDLREVFALMELRGSFPPQAVALGVQPGVVELCDGLSAAVEAALPVVVEAAVEELRRWGHAVPEGGGPCMR